VTTDPFDEAALIRRLSTSSRPVMFVVGAPLTSPQPPETRGVPSVAGMIEMIQQRLALGEEFQLSNSPIQRYEQAMTLWRANRGDRSSLIREAVLRARVVPDSDEIRSRAIAGDAVTCERLELDDSWILSPAVEYLGRIIAGLPSRFGPIILTSNFDPLIEVSIRRAGGQAITIAVDRNASFELAKSPGQAQVVHFHGFWYGSQTLHTPEQLVRDRPQLRDPIARHLQECMCVVIAYGGWSDIFSTALCSLLENQSATPEVIWAFYSKSDPIDDQTGELIKRLRIAHDTSDTVTIFHGVNVHTLMPQLWERLGRPYPRPSKTSIPSPHESISPPRHRPSGLLIERGDRISPHSIEALWGVDRGRFLGLLGGGAEDDALACLAHVEGRLWELTGGDAGPMRWPVRWWIRLDPTRCVEGPEFTRDVWCSCLDSSDPRLRYIAAGGRMEHITLGLLFEMPAAEKIESQMQLLRCWVSALQSIPELPLAAIVARWSNITRPDLAAALEQLRNDFSCAVDGLWLPSPTVSPSNQPASALRGATAEATRIVRCWLAGRRNIPLPDDVRTQLSPEMRLVIEYAEGSISEAEFVRSQGIRAFASALDVGLDFPRALDMAPDVPLSSDYWWLATRLRPTRERLQRLSKLMPAQRAIWGLCSTDEWNDLPPHVKAQVIDARQGRPLLLTNAIDERTL